MVWQRINVIIRYLIFWLIYFVIARILFLCYNLHFTQQLSLGTILLSFVHGFKLDLSMAGYIMMFSTLFLAFTFFLGKRIISPVFKVFTLIVISLFSIMTIVDMELYRNWGFRMDGTILLYLKTPKEAMASTRVWLTIILLVSAFILSLISFKAYKKWVHPEIEKLRPALWINFPLLLILTGFWIIPMRGGIGIAPIRSGSVFFSKHQFANHAAINEPWNFGNSLLYMNKGKVVNLLPESEAKDIFKSLMTPQCDSIPKLLRTKRPNILIIVLESFTAKIIEPLGGVPGVTPEFTKLTKEGILFDHCLASGDRSDKGIVSVLSGYPAQPTTSIIKYTDKSEKLPNLSKELKKLGYPSAFYYGGEIDFANMKSYFILGQYDKLVTLKDFPQSQLNSKWGAHDQFVFGRFLTDINQSKPPFFKAMFTLSSHEPFDVPMNSRFNGTTDESRFLNSVHYTDSCLGDFFRKARQQPWWDSTLVILVADHGNRLPGLSPISSLEKFRIPLLWLGGALTVHDTIVHNYISQTDIPMTIADQMGLTIDGFPFSKDVFRFKNSFAVYAYNNGFGYFDDSVGYIYDLEAMKYVGPVQGDTTRVKNGKVFIQELLNDFDKK